MEMIRTDVQIAVRAALQLKHINEFTARLDFAWLFNKATRFCAPVILAALSACATCERRPTACAVTAIVVAGSIAASAQHHNAQVRTGDEPRICVTNPESCK